MNNANPFDKAHELARAIKKSETYIRYLSAKHEIDKYPEYKDKILKIRTRQMEVNRAHVLGTELPADFLAELSLELSKLNQYKEIAEFLEAETSFINMYQDIQNIVHEALDADLRD